jgi:hypothetical protein
MWCACAADAVDAKAAAQAAAANVSFSYNAPSFLILRIGLLAGQPIEACDLIALEAGVQKVSTSSRCPALSRHYHQQLTRHYHQQLQATTLASLDSQHSVAVVQAVDRLVAQIDPLRQELSREQALNVQLERGACRAQAELEVKLLSSQASQHAMQQVCSQDR